MSTALAGIDVSAAGQGAGFNFEAYRGKIGFAGVKISEGTGYADPDARANIAGARSIGAVPMGYHFLHAGQSAAQQAEKFLSHAKAAGLRPGDLIAIDAEDGGLDGRPAADLDLAAWAFASELGKHFPGFNPVLYTEISLASQFRLSGNCPLWLANPDRVHTGAIGPWKQGVSFEQTGQRGVDTDIFYGDAAQLAELAFR